MRILIVEDESRLAASLGPIMEEKRSPAAAEFDGAGGLA